MQTDALIATEIWSDEEPKKTMDEGDGMVSRGEEKTGRLGENGEEKPYKEEEGRTESYI